MLSNYRKFAAERESLGIPALPLNAQQVQELTFLLEKPPEKESKQFLGEIS